jgi:hypothetical protein
VEVRPEFREATNPSWLPFRQTLAATLQKSHGLPNGTSISRTSFQAHESNVVPPQRLFKTGEREAQESDNSAVLAHRRLESESFKASGPGPVNQSAWIL